MNSTACCMLFLFSHIGRKKQNERIGLQAHLNFLKNSAIYVVEILRGKIECLEEVTNVQIPVRNSVGVGSIFFS